MPVRGLDVLQGDDIPYRTLFLLVDSVRVLALRKERSVVCVVFEIVDNEEYAGRGIEVRFSITHRGITYLNRFLIACGADILEHSEDDAWHVRDYEECVGRTVQADISTMTVEDFLGGKHSYAVGRNWAAWTPPWDTRRSVPAGERGGEE